MTRLPETWGTRLKITSGFGNLERQVITRKKARG
jgi:hypothetical protein